MDNRKTVKLGIDDVQAYVDVNGKIHFFIGTGGASVEQTSQMYNNFLSVHPEYVGADVEFRVMPDNGEELDITGMNLVYSTKDGQLLINNYVASHTLEDSKNPMFIRKEAGKKKDALRISKEEDIPEELKDAIKIENGMLLLDCVEGRETAPLGSVIGYEKSSKTRSGINTWHIANAATNLVEIDGEFYTKATINKAQKIGEELPEFMQGAEVVRNEDGSYTVTTDWGQSTGYPGEAYFVRYGTKEDGTPDVNILNKSEASFDTYFVCDEEGNIIGKLSDVDLASLVDEKPGNSIRR